GRDCAALPRRLGDLDGCGTADMGRLRLPGEEPGRLMGVAASTGVDCSASSSGTECGTPLLLATGCCGCGTAARDTVWPSNGATALFFFRSLSAAMIVASRRSASLAAASAA